MKRKSLYFTGKKIIKIKKSEGFVFIQAIWQTIGILTLTSPKARSRQEVSFITLRETAAEFRLSKASNISRNNYSE